MRGELIKGSTFVKHYQKLCKQNEKAFSISGKIFLLEHYQQQFDALINPLIKIGAVLERLDVFPVIKLLNTIGHKMVHLPGSPLYSPSNPVLDFLLGIARLIETTTYFACGLRLIEEDPYQFILKNSEKAGFFLFAKGTKHQLFYYNGAKAITYLKLSPENQQKIIPFFKKERRIATVEELYFLLEISSHSLMRINFIHLKQEPQLYEKSDLAKLCGFIRSYALSNARLFEINAQGDFLPLIECPKKILPLFPSQLDNALQATAEDLVLLHEETARSPFIDNRFLLVVPLLRQYRIGSLNLDNPNTQYRQFIFDGHGFLIDVRRSLNNTGSNYHTPEGLVKPIPTHLITNHSDEANLVWQIKNYAEELEQKKEVDLGVMIHLFIKFLQCKTDYDIYKLVRFISHKKERNNLSPLRHYLLPHNDLTTSSIDLIAEDEGGEIYLPYLKDWLLALDKAERHNLLSITRTNCILLHSKKSPDDLKLKGKSDYLILYQNKLLYFRYKSKSFIPIDDVALEEIFSNLTFGLSRPATQQELIRIQKATGKTPINTNSYSLGRIICQLFRLWRPTIMFVNEKEINDLPIDFFKDHCSQYLVTTSEIFQITGRPSRPELKQIESYTVEFVNRVPNDEEMLPYKLYVHYSHDGTPTVRFKTAEKIISEKIPTYLLQGRRTCYLTTSAQSITYVKGITDIRLNHCYVLAQEGLFYFNEKRILEIGCTPDQIKQLRQLFPEIEQYELITDKISQAIYKFSKHRPNWPIAREILGKGKSQLIYSLREKKLLEDQSILCQELREYYSKKPEKKSFKLDWLMSLLWYKKLALGFESHTPMTSCINELLNNAITLLKDNSAHYPLISCNEKTLKASQEFIQVLLSEAKKLFDKALDNADYKRRPLESHKAEKEAILQLGLPELTSVNEQVKLLERIAYGDEELDLSVISLINRKAIYQLNFQSLDFRCTKGFAKQLINHACVEPPENLKEWLFHDNFYEHKPKNLPKYVRTVKNLRQLTTNLWPLRRFEEIIFPQIKDKIPAILLSLNDFISLFKKNNWASMFYPFLCEFLYKSSSPWQDLIKIEQHLLLDNEFYNHLNLSRWLDQFPMHAHQKEWQEKKTPLNLLNKILAEPDPQPHLPFVFKKNEDLLCYLADQSKKRGAEILDKLIQASILPSLITTGKQLYSLCRSLKMSPINLFIHLNKPRSYSIFKDYNHLNFILYAEGEIFSKLFIEHNDEKIRLVLLALPCAKNHLKNTEIRKKISTAVSKASRDWQVNNRFEELIPAEARESVDTDDRYVRKTIL